MAETPFNIVATFFFLTPGSVAMVLAKALLSPLVNRLVLVIHHSVPGSMLKSAYMESQWS